MPVDVYSSGIGASACVSREELHLLAAHGLALTARDAARPWVGRNKACRATTTSETAMFLTDGVLDRSLRTHRIIILAKSAAADERYSFRVLPAT